MSITAARVLEVRQLRNGIHFPGRVNAQSSKRLLPLIGVLILGALGLAGYAIAWAVHQSDQAAIDRQLQMTERSIRSIVRELSLQQEVVAVWDDPVLQLDKPSPNTAWIDENLGAWLNRTYGHNQIYILNPKNEAVYASLDGVQADASAFDQVHSAVRKHVDELRKREATPHRKPGEPPTDDTYLTTGRAVYDAHLLKLLDRPAAVSIMRIVPYSDALSIQSGSEFVLVSVRFLDGSFLKELADKNLIENLHFSAAPIKARGEVSVPLESDVGELIGYFVWKPETPGTKILSVMGPVSFLMGILILAVLCLLLRWLWGVISALEKTVIELSASEAQAQHLAFHDVLTGLPNRALFNERVDQALARTHRGEKAAVLMLDLDRFKHVNDTLGHHAGDSLIREFAGRLSDLVGGIDTVARLGGDEFAVVKTGIAGVEEVEDLCARILAAVRQPFDALGHQTFVGVSIGIVLAPEFGTDRIEIMRRADIALYHAKAEGRECYRLFTTAMDETVQVRSALEEDLRAVLTTGQGLEVAYQPQVGAVGHPVLGLEALLRWRHPTRGMIPPDQFIPVAEHSGLISQLGEFVLREACSAAKSWPGVFISVNLSPVQFRSEGFADRIVEIVRSSGVDPGRIELEITESVFLDEGGRATQALKALRAAGFRIALDDFGTGYSSLSYLRQFDVDKIKIDRSFVSSLGQEEGATAIVNAIIALGQAMNLTVTAEGVETKEQQTFLRQAGCDELQGYLFSKAVSKDQLASLLNRSRQPAQDIAFRPAPLGA